MHVSPIAKSANSWKLKSQYQPDQTASLCHWQGKCSSRSRTPWIVQNWWKLHLRWRMAAITEIHKQVYLTHFCQISSAGRHSPYTCHLFWGHVLGRFGHFQCALQQPWTTKFHPNCTNVSRVMASHRWWRSQYRSFTSDFFGDFAHLERLKSTRIPNFGDISLSVAICGWDIITSGFWKQAFAMLEFYFCTQGSHASWKVLEIPGILFVKFPGPGKSWKMGLVLESPGNFSWKSWKVLEFFARLWRGRRTQWCRCRCQNMRVCSAHIFSE